jgi:hypothetical protein
MMCDHCAEIGRNQAGMSALEERMIGVLAAGGVVLSLLAPSSVAAAPPPAPGQVVIELVKANGSGCRKPTTEVDIAPDRTAFTVTYSDYLVQIGPGAKPKDARKECNLNVRLDIPPGYSYALSQADYRGFGQLERGVSAVQAASYYFPGGSKKADVKRSFRGPYDDNWLTTDRLADRDLDWAACGKSRKLNIDTELRVSAGTSTPTETSMMAMDSTDGSVKTRYHFAWKRC